MSSNATVLYDENLTSYLPMICVDSISNIKILYSDRNGNCGIVRIELPMQTAKISTVFNTAPYATENGIHNLFDYELPLTTEKSTELWTNVGTAIQTFYNSLKTENDKAKLKEALSVGFGIPFCYLLKVNFIGKYNSYLDNVVNNLTNSSIGSEQISQALSYTNQINDIITAIQFPPVANVLQAPKNAPGINSSGLAFAWKHITNEKNPVSIYDQYEPGRYFVPSIVHIAQTIPEILAKIDLLSPATFVPDAK